MNDGSQEEELAQQVVTYKKSATELYTAALQSVPKHSKKPILDSMLVLFALDVSRLIIPHEARQIQHVLNFNRHLFLLLAHGMLA